MIQIKNKKYQKIKIELTEKNEQKLREIHQFQSLDCSFEKFINDLISDTLVNLGF